jgi:hypothetical protein
MRHRRCLAAFGAAALIALALPRPAGAWNVSGHMLVATIAYERLTPPARARVDQLLAKHPEYPAWTAGVPAGERGLVAFQRAAGWPDEIKDDARFHDDEKPATAPVAGYPTMKRHKAWHYHDVPISRGWSPQPPPAASALGVLPLIIDELRTPLEAEAMKAYYLPWVIHMVGDLHQPLHCAQLFSPTYKEGDGGGNRFKIEKQETGQENLHAFWDDVLIAENSPPEQIRALAAALVAEHPAGAAAVDAEAEVAKWIGEGAELAATRVYALADGTEQRRTRLPEDYRTAARALVRERAALAGYRLAALLNAIL